MVKSGCGLLGHGTEKSTFLKNELINYADTNSGKLKVTLIVFGWAWSKMVMSFYAMRL